MEMAARYAELTKDNESSKSELRALQGKHPTQ